jgi:hypothetical protein
MPQKEITKAQQRFVEHVVDIHEMSAQDADSLSYMTRVLIQATMPHRDPGDVPVYGRSNGNFSMTIQPGFRMVNNEPVNLGIPYGSLPRLLMAWITTEAVRTKERQIVLGHSLSEFMRQLDMIPTGGRWGSITRLKDQMNRLFSARVSFRYSDGVEASYNTNIAKKTVFWWDEKHPYQDSLFKSYILLEQEFFDEIIDRPVPVDMRALKALKQSPLGLDLYMWLTYRMSYLRKPTPIPWKVLQEQFGADYSHTYDFTKKAKNVLKRIQLLYPELNLEEKRGRLILNPSRPHIAKR